MNAHDNGRSNGRDDAGLSDEETRQRLRSLLAPLVNDLARTTPAHADDTKPRAQSRAHETPSTLSTTPSSNGTDLPLPQSGSSGSRSGDDDDRGQPTAAELMEVLDRLLLVPAAPPLHDLDPHVVVRWVEAASTALLYRRDRRRLVREVLRVLDEEWATAREIEQRREQVAAREEAQREREEGTYWKRRESGRVAQRAIRVEVDPQVWTRARAAARREGVGIGEYVGRLIAAEVARRPHDRSAARFAEVHARRVTKQERLFARVAVDPLTWTEFVAMSHAAQIAVSRYVGSLVEAVEDDD